MSTKTFLAAYGFIGFLAFASISQASPAIDAALTCTSKSGKRVTVVEEMASQDGYAALSMSLQLPGQEPAVIYSDIQINTAKGEFQAATRFEAEIDGKHVVMTLTDNRGIYLSLSEDQVKGGIILDGRTEPATCTSAPI